MLWPDKMEKPLRASSPIEMDNMPSTSYKNVSKQEGDRKLPFSESGSNPNSDVEEESLLDFSINDSDIDSDLVYDVSFTPPSGEDAEDEP